MRRLPTLAILLLALAAAGCPPGPGQRPAPTPASAAGAPAEAAPDAVARLLARFEAGEPVELPDAVLALGRAAEPELRRLLREPRKIALRIEPAREGGRFVELRRLKASDEGARCGVAEFAFFCLAKLREPAEGTFEQYQAYWKPVLAETADADGAISAQAMAAMNP